MKPDPLSPIQIEERMKKGLKLNDRFSDMINKTAPNVTQLFDAITENKQSKELEMRGKPNIIPSFSG